VSPRNAFEDERGTRTYVWRGRGYPEAFLSVTSLISLGVPKYLVAWAAKLVAELAWQDVNLLGRQALDEWRDQGLAYLEEARAAGLFKTVNPAKLTDSDLAVRWLKGAPDRSRDTAAKRGTQVHKASEDIVRAHAREATHLILEGKALPEWPDVIAPYMRSFLQWVKDFRPVIEATEATIYNRSQQYAGTLDLLARVPQYGPDVRVIDYKSGNRVYPEVGLQLAPYARGEFVAAPDDVTEIPMPEVNLEHGFVLHLTPKEYVFRRAAIDEPIWRAFLYVREVARYAVDIAPTVLSAPLVPEALEEVA
jgi:hypothetical protein